jgi:hypothetical protein
MSRFSFMYVTIALTFFSLTFSSFFGYPIFRFLTSEIGTFDDLRNPLYFATNYYKNYPNGGINPGNPIEYLYTPFQVAFYSFFSHFPFRFSLIFLTLVTCGVLFSCIYFYCRTQTLLLLGVFSYPLIFAVSRGNDDLWLVTILLIALTTLKFGNLRSAGFLFAVLVSFDPLLLIFLIPFLKSMYRRFLVSFTACSIALFLIPLAYFKRSPLVAIQDLFLSYADYRDGYVAGNGGLLMGNSFTGVFKSLYLWLSGANMSHSFSTLISILGLLLELTLCGVIFLRAKKDSFDSGNLILLVCILTLFGGAGADYKLLYFIVPFVFIWGKKGTSLSVVPVLICILVIPKHWVWWTFVFDSSGFTINSIINPIILFILISSLLLRRGDFIK